MFVMFYIIFYLLKYAPMYKYIHVLVNYYSNAVHLKITK